jgi:lysophospholipase L1-like esterase
VLAALTFAALAAAAAEVLLRQAYPSLAMRRYDDRFTGSEEIAINARGFRGALPAPDTEELVVLCLGDSTTYGTGVAASETWPLRLGVPHGADASLAGINAAMPGTDLGQAKRSIDTIWSDYHPAAVAVALSGNMVSLALIRRGDESSIAPHPTTSKRGDALSLRRRLRYLVSDSALAGGLLWLAETIGYACGVHHHRIDPDAPFGALLAQGWTQAGLDPNLAEEAWRAVGQDLAILRDWCRDRGIPLVATWIPSRFAMSAAWRDNLKWVPRDRLSIDANARCRRLCEDLGIPFVDTQQGLQEARVAAASTGDRPPLYIHGDYTHLDADGHAAVAEAMQKAIRETIRASREAP